MVVETGKFFKAKIMTKSLSVRNEKESMQNPNDCSSMVTVVELYELVD